MYKATREFIKARQPHAKFVVEVVTGVRKIGGGNIGKCLDNAQKQVDHAKGIKIVSGWVVNKYDTRANLTAIVQHWWNVDSNGFFDTSIIEDHYEYVIDMDLAQYASENEDKLESRIAYSIKLKDGHFSLIDVVDDDVTDIPVKELQTPILFKHLHSI